MVTAKAEKAASSENTFHGIVRSCAALFDESLALVMETDDPSGPHKARVALRRLTTAIDSFGPILRRKQSAALRSQAKAIFRKLGEIRDNDVYLLGSSESVAPKPATDRVASNRRLREKVRKKLRKSCAVRFAQQVLLAAEEDGKLYRRSTKAKALRAGSVVAFAARALSDAWSSCRSYGPSVEKIPETDRHDFRKDLKTLRYLAEFFSDHFPNPGDKSILRDFRAMQDALGAMNDFAVMLKIEGREPPRQPPLIVSEALTAAEVIWARLYDGRLPWSDQPTLRP